MSSPVSVLDLGTLGLSAGEGRRLKLPTELAALELGGQRYEPLEPRPQVLLDVSRMNSLGYALRLRFRAGLTGPCVRCLDPARPFFSVDAREIDQPGGGEELSSPYVAGEALGLADWSRDALALALPEQILCRRDCAGLCPECAANLNEAGPDHRHERGPDPRWAKLRELDLSGE